MRNGVIEIDLCTRLVFVGGRELHFTRTEFRLLLALAEQAPAIVSPQELVWQAAGYRVYPIEARELVKWHIHHMRRKMRDNARKPRYILNVRDEGYRLAAVPLIHSPRRALLGLELSGPTEWRMNDARSTPVTIPCSISGEVQAR